VKIITIFSMDFITEQEPSIILKVAHNLKQITLPQLTYMYNKNY